MKKREAEELRRELGLTQKETGIIMSGDHPQKILDDIKTMTRRTWGLEKINQNPDRYSNPAVYKGITGEWFAWFHDKESSNPVIIKCPYGGIGDALWVKETWGYGVGDLPSLIYKADIFDPELLPENLPLYQQVKWKSGRFMFKIDSRINLEITGLRAERLQEITPQDIRAEGVSAPIGDFFGLKDQAIMLRDNFIVLWDSINGKRSPWSSNSWVWPIEFRRPTDVPH